MAVSSKHTVVEEYLKISSFNSPYILSSILEKIGCTRLDKNQIESLIGYRVSSSSVEIDASQDSMNYGFSHDNPLFSTPVCMGTGRNHTVFSMDIEKDVYCGAERIEFLISNLRTSTFRIVFERNGLGHHTIFCSYVDSMDLIRKDHRLGQNPFEPLRIDECIDRLNDYIVVP